MEKSNLKPDFFLHEVDGVVYDGFQMKEWINRLTLSWSTYAFDFKLCLVFVFGISSSNELNLSQSSFDN